MSKTASGNGRSRRARLVYKPVSGDRKSGMPADVLIPAPVYEYQSVTAWHLQLGIVDTITTIFLARPFRISDATASRERSERVSGETFSSTRVELS